MVEPITDERLAYLRSQTETDDEAGVMMVINSTHVAALIARIEQVGRELDGERQAREASERALRNKDAAMDVLFDRMTAAGVDYSDLLS